jgi:hypothetical protein
LVRSNLNGFWDFCHGTPIPWVLVHPRHLQWCSLSQPVKKDFTSKFSYLLFCNPTHKTETGTTTRWGTTNSKPPRRIIMMGQSETLSSSRIIFITLLFLQVYSVGTLFNQPPQSVHFCRSKTHFPELNRQVLTFLHPILLCRITY